MTPEQRKHLLELEALASARAALSTRQAAVQDTSDVGSPGLLDRFGDALHYGADTPIENTATTAKALGFDETGAFLSDLTTAPDGYRSAALDVDKNLEEGHYLEAISYLPRLGAEQLGQFGGALIARASGGAAGGIVGGPVGAAAGAIAGPAALGFAQQLGPVALERARNEGRTEPNRDDWLAAAATAAASGLMDSAAPGVAGGLRRVATEGVTELGQGYVEQVGSSAGTGAGLQIDHSQAITEGLGGVASAGIFDASVKGAKIAADLPNKLSDVRWDDRHAQYDENDVELARRIREHSLDDADIGHVSSTDGQRSAQGVAKGVLKTLRAEADAIKRELVKQAKSDEARTNLQTLDDELNAIKKDVFEDTTSAVIADINSVVNSSKNMKARVSDKAIRDLERIFPNSPQATRLTGLLKQIQKVTPFTEAKGDLGGLNQWTRLLDPFDGRSGIGRFGLAAHGAGVAGIAPISLAGSATAIGINRAARGIDNLTNRRSRVKRYTESVERAVKFRGLEDRTNADRVSDLKKLADEARVQRQLDAQSQVAAQAVNGVSHQNSTSVGPVGPMPNLAAMATDGMFDSGVVPEDHYYAPWREWQKATGLNPKQTYTALTQMEAEGKVQPGTAQRFRYDVRSFQTKGNSPEANSTYNLQQAVRAQFNPEYSAVHAAAQEARKTAPFTDVSSVGIHAKRNVMLAREGARVWNNVGSAIDAASDELDASTYAKLLKLRHAINRGDVLQDERMAQVEDVLSGLFRNPIEYSRWHKVFSPLATIGGDRVPEKWKTGEDTSTGLDEKIEKTKEAEKRYKKRKAKGGKAKSKTEPAANSNSEPTGARYPTPANVNAKPDFPTAYPFSDSKINDLIEKSKTPQGDDPADEKPTDASALADAQSPKPNPALDESKGDKKRPRGNKKGIARRIAERVETYERAVQRSVEHGEALAATMKSLESSVEGRVEGLIYDAATDELTVNMLIDSFAARYGIPPHEAARIVYSTLKGWEDAGAIRLVSRFKGNTLRREGEAVRDGDGNMLHVLHIELLNPDLVSTAEVAKSVALHDRMVSVDGPSVDYSVSNLHDGAQSAFKDYADNEVDESFMPIVNAINDLRRMPMAIHGRMLSQIEDALDGNSGHTAPVSAQLTPKTDDGEVDKSPLYAVAQLLFQLGTKDRRSDNTFHQEWFAGANGRIYSKNGQAHSQGGDLMKGLIRSAVKAPIGGRTGLDFMFHSFGNLIGYDKESPKDRRDAVFQPGRIKALLDFANDPFGRTRLGDKTKKARELSAIVDKGEGFFQVLNVAHEVADMVTWASARHKGLAKDPERLLRDPAVQQDIAENYSTDFIVQLDASNNAYQIAGLLMGAERLLQATGMAPRPGVENPDVVKGADIYAEPAAVVVDRIPELKALELPPSAIRKLFKKPIGTYLYATAFESRREALVKELKSISKGAPIFGVGEKPGLIGVPENIVMGLASEEGHTFLPVGYGLDSQPTGEKPIRRRVVERDGKFFIDSDKSKAGRGFKKTKQAFDTFEDAVAEAYARDFNGRVDRELVTVFEGMYPEVRDFLGYAKSVSDFIRDRGTGPNGEFDPSFINVPTPDGIMLKYSFKEKGSYAGLEVERPGKAKSHTYRLGYATGDAKLTGRGLAAFIAHQIDAYALRESYRRLGGRSGLKTFQPIHDSYGFHPSDAARGQAAVLEVMQEVGQGDFNIFLNILDANGIDPAEFLQAGGKLPDRKHVQPRTPSQIPTALS